MREGDGVVSFREDGWVSPADVLRLELQLVMEARPVVMGCIVCVDKRAELYGKQVFHTVWQ